GEWVEIRNRSGGALDLRGHALLDRSGTRARPDSAARCAADSPIVIAPDRAPLLAAVPELGPSLVWSARPRPPPHNSDNASGIADAVRWRDAEDLPSDRVDYSADWAPPGVPIERDPEGRWRASLDPRGSPTRPGREPTSISGSFALLRPVVPVSGDARMAWA